MARRSIEVYEYRQALRRVSQGDDERGIARSKPMGRSKVARFRELARQVTQVSAAKPDVPLLNNALLTDPLIPAKA